MRAHVCLGEGSEEMGCYRRIGHVVVSYITSMSYAICPKSMHDEHKGNGLIKWLTKLSVINFLEMNPQEMNLQEMIPDQNKRGYNFSQS